jgi:uncharacterized protein (TIGR03083 family)
MVHVVDHLEHCDVLEAEVRRFAGAQANTADDLAIPSCPGWTLLDLASHLGTVHRWAEHLVRVRAVQRIPDSEMHFERGPVTPVWLEEGGLRLVATLRGVDPEEPMWAWGADQHARFWSRRQLHETLVHRIDVELATGRRPEVESSIAADCIDEFLVNLSMSAAFSPSVRGLRGDKRTLCFRVDDGTASWTATLLPDGFTIASGGNSGDAMLTACALDLLLILYRRSTHHEPGVLTDGDPELIDFWLRHAVLV